MPVKAYFKGRGRKVMHEMKEKYKERGEEVFYRTANKMGMKPKSHMIHGGETPHGDIGAMRQEEAGRVAKSLGGKIIKASSYLPNRPGKVSY